ncbi:MAG: PKD domain-containing protein [Candidatus Latescibacteria bacterium]|nr:PKD domain-containing protein [bacterium]MBD3423474.1 PKD domain-containing protein [Candidatus Latescibacterota bacterium]
MINHQLAFYGYKAVNYPPGEHLSDWNWNRYVQFHIGQPVVNTLGLDDFRGNSGTDRYFVWKESDEYEILGREYRREDGLHVLVLSKLMAEGREEGADPTTHLLPGCYQAVQPDLSLGAPTREITLCNNAGAILVATDGCQAPPGVEFSADRTFGFIPLTVEFRDNSSNFPTSWEWEFGDGGISTDQNPRYTYDQPGVYTVSLTATNCDGSGTRTETSFIIVNENEDAGGRVDPHQP